MREINNQIYRKTRLNPPVSLFPPPFENFDFIIFDFYALIPPLYHKFFYIKKFIILFIIITN